MAITRKKNLGLLLIEAGIIEPEQLEQALLKQSKEINSGYIGDILIKAGLIDEKNKKSISKSTVTYSDSGIRSF
ncbi:MAG: hypothetical protein ACJZ19_00115 [Candidatus Neomarinimicrobiota bacterium]